MTWPTAWPKSRRLVRSDTGRPSSRIRRIVGAPTAASAGRRSRARDRAGGGDRREALMFEGIVSRSGRRMAVTVAVLAMVVAACSGGGGTGADGGKVEGGGPTGGPVAAGGDLCKLLGPGDFAAAGVSGAGGPSENNSPPSYFCVYKGKSSATGGIEFDGFVSDTAADAHETFVDLFGEFDSSDDTAVSIAGADEASLSLPAVRQLGPRPHRRAQGEARVRHRGRHPASRRRQDRGRAQEARRAGRGTRVGDRRLGGPRRAIVRPERPMLSSRFGRNPGRRVLAPVVRNHRSKGTNHQSRPARQPDDPDPTGSCRR